MVVLIDRAGVVLASAAFAFIIAWIVYDQLEPASLAALAGAGVGLFAGKEEPA